VAAQATMKVIRKENLDADSDYVVSYAALRRSGMVRMALQVRVNDARAACCGPVSQPSAPDLCVSFCRSGPKLNL